MSNRNSAKRVRNIIICAVVILVILFAASFWSMIAANYTREDAQRIAQTEIAGGGGIANRAEWDWEVWRWVWYVEVHHEGTTFGVYVNPVNGQVIRWDGW